jgi:putative effector of murein hydrolase LrgA (UPF0299 family)
MRQRSLAPTRKVAAGAVADAVMVVLGYALEQGFRTTLPLPVYGACLLLVGLAVSYFTPPAVEDAPVPAARRRRDPIGH